MGQFLDEAPSRGKFLDEPASPAPQGQELIAKGIVSSGMGTGTAGQAESFEKTASQPNISTLGSMGGTAAGSRFGPPGRVIGGGIGGAGGALIEGSDPIVGAAKGSGLAAAGEIGSALLSKLLRSVPGAKARIAGQDAARYGEEMGRQAPPLAGATTADELRNLAAGPGRQALGDAKEQAITQIETLMRPRPSLPSADIAVPALGPTRMTLRDANNRLSEIGARAFSKNPQDRNILGVDQRQLYGQVANEIRDALPTTARPLWDSAQADYRRGISLLRPLQASQSYRQYPDELQLNTPALQTYVANPRNEAALRNKLGDQGFEALVNALTRGGGVGTKDILASGQGRMLDAVRQSFGRGTNTGSLQLLGVPFRTALPNAGSQYAGQAPYTLPHALQTILDVALQRGAAQ